MILPLIDAIATLRSAIACPELVRRLGEDDLLPVFLIRRAGNVVLSLICPRGVNSALKPDFSGLRLSLPARVKLRELWEGLVTRFWDHCAAGEKRNNWLVFLDELIGMLRAEIPFPDEPDIDVDDMESEDLEDDGIPVDKIS